MCLRIEIASSTSMASLPVQLHARRAALVSANAREPRTVSAALVTGTVTVSESCEFYGIADAVSRCRLPRSCQDCLATPGCGLTDSGYCRNVTSEADEFTLSPDYRTANFSLDSLISTTSRFVFLADSASYCAASDPVCTKCREQFQADDANKTSKSYTRTQFCKGAGGCVCIAICEVPRRRAAIVLDWQCDPPYIRADPLPAISRGSNMSGRGDPRAPAVKLTQPPKDQESCEYTKEVDLRGCRRPRTCQSCLETPPCEIREGRCYAATSEYSASRDYRNASLDANNVSGASNYAFTSSNTTYCPASDSTCAACRQQFQKRKADGWMTLVLNFNTFCVGQDGCVCIELCESELRATGVVDTACNRMYGGDKYPSPAGLLAGAVAAWLVLWCFYKFNFYARRSRAQEQRRLNARRHQNLWRNMLDEVPDLPFLDLFGWRAYREQAYNREQDELGGREVSRVWHPVDFENTDPTAPDFDEDESSAPTAQDPKALASAPIYRSSFHDRDSSSEGTGSSTNDTDHSSPSAPDFEEEVEEAEWGLRLSHIGLVARRSRRGE